MPEYVTYHLGGCRGHLLQFIKWKVGQDLGAREQKEALETYIVLPLMRKPRGVKFP